MKWRWHLAAVDIWRCILFLKKNKLTEQNEMPQIKLHRHPVVQTLDLATLLHNSQQLQCPEQ